MTRVRQRKNNKLREKQQQTREVALWEIEASAAVQMRAAVSTRGGAKQNGEKGRADQSGGAGESSVVDWSSGAGGRSEAGGSGAGQERQNRLEPQLSRSAGTDGEHQASECAP